MPARAPADPLESIARVLERFTAEQLREIVPQLEPADVAIIERVLGDIANTGWRANPVAMANHLTNGTIKQYAYSQLLGEKFVDAVEGRSIRQIWNLPARYGKSLIASQWGPTYALDRYPWYKIALTSYGDELANENATAVRDLLVQHGDVLECRLRKDRRRGDRFVTEQGGGLIGAGIGSGLTGFGAHGIVIDDPFKNWQEAHSEARRLHVWNWYRSVPRLRLETDTSWIIVVMCMTGDTPVLLADGTERPLRDIRPGDQVATYEQGRLTSSTVQNWANQGPDKIFKVRMKSGISVRANARHPFLIVENGAETWRQLQDLKVGDAIVRAMQPGEACGESSAPLRDATDRQGARACACRTTAKPDGQQATVHHPRTPTRDGAFDSRDATESPPSSTTQPSQNRTAGARSAEGYPRKSTDRSTGPRSSASTMITSRASDAGCSATTATSSSHEGTRPPFSVPPLSTWSVGQDEVESVALDGYEDVFDLQIDRTENFIANGLTAHNTRWHEDDLAGRLLTADLEGEGEGWELVRLPAIAETPNPKSPLPWMRAPDPLGRARGEPLEPLRFSLESCLARARALGGYLTAGMEQQRPAPEEGTDIMRAWWKWYDAPPPKFDASCTSWDMKLKDKEAGDFVVGQAWGRTGGDYWALDQLRGQWNQTTTKTAIVLMQVRHPKIRMHVVENTGNGPEVMAELRRAQPGYSVSEETRSELGITDDEVPKVNALFRRGMSGLLPEIVKGDKRVRARAQTPLVEAGNVHLPLRSHWAEGFVDEASTFPNGSHDDQVDAWSQALKRLAGGRGTSTKPSGTVKTPSPGARSAPAKPTVGRSINQAVRTARPRRGVIRR